MTGEYTLLQRTRLQKLVDRMEQGEEPEVQEILRKPLRKETA